MQKIIYALKDPKTKEIRYIGYTEKDIVVRLKQHIYESRRKNSSHKHHWILSILTDNLIPEIEIIEIVNNENWQEREKFWIDKYKNRLTNLCDGGQGLINPSIEVRNRIGKHSRQRMLGKKLRLGIPHTDEYKSSHGSKIANSEKYILAIKNRKQHSPEHLAAIKSAVSKANKGIPKSENHRNKISMSAKGKRYINNGILNKKIGPTDLLPEGWEFGRYTQTKETK